jgi:DNA-directed RNA polymerase specialized sigma subunit
MAKYSIKIFKIHKKYLIGKIDKGHKKQLTNKERQITHMVYTDELKMDQIPKCKS